MWAAEARRKMISRQIDDAGAALLPFQKPSNIRAYIDQLKNGLAEINTTVNIEEVDAENEKRIGEMNARLARRRKSGFKKQAKRPAPKHARSIR